MRGRGPLWRFFIGLGLTFLLVEPARGQTGALLRRVQRDLETYYFNRLVKLERELPYAKKAVVVTRDGHVRIQPVDPKDKAEERYAKITRKYKIIKVKIEREYVEFWVAPFYLSPRTLPTPPINPEEPPWTPEEPPPLPKPSKIPFKKAGPVHFTVVLEYTSLEELVPDRLNARLQPVLRVITDK